MKFNLAVKITVFLSIILIGIFLIIYFSVINHFNTVDSVFSALQVKKMILWSFVLAFVLSVLTCFLICRFCLRYLNGLSGVARDISKGDFSKRIFLNTHDELSDLSQSINDMVEQMEGKVNELVANKSRLEAVFLSMFDGVMVVAQDQQIILMNQTLKDFLRVTQDPVGRKPLEIIRNVEIQTIIEEVLRRNNPLKPRELIVFLPEEKILLIHAAPVIREQKQEGAVLVFHDITEVRHLENIRRDFVANVSHELRTPVSTIKGYAETLLDGALDDKKHAREFMQIIYADSERLAKLVTDLLDLSKIESGKMKLTISHVTLRDLVNKVFDLLKKQIKERSLNVLNDIDANLIVQADETKLTQVFLNLMENAIKYNKLGGDIKISAQAKGNVFEIKIADTGLGIPEEDIPRVFERFYRVDKAHSRHLGGTGLGLAIVKHIIQIHGGEVSVQSRINQGSTFSFTLPRF